MPWQWRINSTYLLSWILSPTIFFPTAPKKEYKNLLLQPFILCLDIYCLLWPEHPSFPINWPTFSACLTFTQLSNLFLWKALSDVLGLVSSSSLAPSYLCMHQLVHSSHRLQLVGQFASKWLCKAWGQDCVSFFLMPSTKLLTKQFSCLWIII